jgi:hypothetical protein
MDWTAALLARVRANAGVQALVGLDANNKRKIYWEQAPQGTTRPYVTLLDVTELRPQILKGWDLEAGRVQVDVWADSYTIKNNIMEAILAALVPGGTSNGHVFQRADIVMGPRDIAGERDGTIPVFRKTADLTIHHTTA